MKQKISQYRFADKLSIAETHELKRLIEELEMKQDEARHLAGIKHSSTFSKMMNNEQVNARFRSVLELLRVRTTLKKLIY